MISIYIFALKYLTCSLTLVPSATFCYAPLESVQCSLLPNTRKDNNTVSWTATVLNSIAGRCTCSCLFMWLAAGCPQCCDNDNGGLTSRTIGIRPVKMSLQRSLNANVNTSAGSNESETIEKPSVEVAPTTFRLVLLIQITLSNLDLLFNRHNETAFYFQPKKRIFSSCDLEL